MLTGPEPILGWVGCGLGGATGSRGLLTFKEFCEGVWGPDWDGGRPGINCCGWDEGR